jgi:hypothetical protein
MQTSPTTDLQAVLKLLDDAEQIVAAAGLPPADSAALEFAVSLTAARRAVSHLLQPGPDAQRIPPRNMDPMKIALRVLTQITQHTEPDPWDLDALVRICGHAPEGVGWDEFACEALQKVLKDRAAARNSLAIGSGGSR